MVDFTDPNLWVQKDQAGNNLQLYTFDKALGLVFKEKIESPNLELRFDGNHIIKGPNYVKLLDYLKHRSIFVNCLGRIYVVMAGNGDTVIGGTFMVQSYFPWHTFGGPPVKFDRSSLSEVVDLNGDKVPGLRQDEDEDEDDEDDDDGENMLRDENTDLKSAVDGLQKANDDLKRVRDENADLKKAIDDLLKANSELEEDMKTGSGPPGGGPASFLVGRDIYFFQNQIPYEDADYHPTDAERIGFTPQQIAGRDYGFAFRAEGGTLTYRYPDSTLYPNGTDIVRTVHYSTGASGIYIYASDDLANGPSALILALYRYQEKGTDRQITLAVVSRTHKIITHVALKRWKRIGLHRFEARQGSIWF